MKLATIQRFFYKLLISTKEANFLSAISKSVALYVILFPLAPMRENK